MPLNKEKTQKEQYYVRVAVEYGVDSKQGDINDPARYTAKQSEGVIWPDLHYGDAALLQYVTIPEMVQELADITTEMGMDQAEALGEITPEQRKFAENMREKVRTRKAGNKK